MAKYLITSDWHIGLQRKANTTQQSSKRLQQRLVYMAEALQDTYGELADHIIMVGDLYDKFRNEEEVLLQGLKLASGLSVVLGGNHDVSNDKTQHGTFKATAQLSKELGYPTVFVPPFSGLTAGAKNLTRMVFVPHQDSQGEFEKELEHMLTLKELVMSPIGSASQPNAYLFLHCTYDRNFGGDESSATLNLTKAMAQKILDAGFSRIFIGHEHQPAEYLNGRVVIVGNHYPTSFGDISDKRVLLLDTETDSVESIPTVTKQDLYWKGPFSMAEDNIRPFMDIVGEVQSLRGLFANEQVLAVRLRDDEELEIDGEDSAKAVEDLPTAIRNALVDQKPSLVPMFDKLIQAGGCE